MRGWRDLAGVLVFVEMAVGRAFARGFTAVIRALIT